MKKKQSCMNKIANNKSVNAVCIDHVRPLFLA